MRRKCSSQDGKTCPNTLYLSKGTGLCPAHRCPYPSCQNGISKLQEDCGEHQYDVKGREQRGACWAHVLANLVELRATVSSACRGSSLWLSIRVNVAKMTSSR